MVLITTTLGSQFGSKTVAYMAYACCTGYYMYYGFCGSDSDLFGLGTTENGCKDWTWVDFGDLYAYTSQHQNTIESKVFSLFDVKISSDGKTDWTMVELQQPVKVCSIFQKQSFSE